MRAVAEIKQALTRKLDSLDLEKQVLKRSGQSISDIELQQTELLDSLKLIREKIQSSYLSQSRPYKATSKVSIPRPQSLFDWIIVAVGATAVLSGLILIIGLLKTFSSKPRRRRTNSLKKKATQTYTQMQHSEPLQKPVLPPPEHPVFPDTLPDPITRLRMRIIEESKTEEAMEQTPVHNVHSPVAHSTTLENDQEKDISNKILNASNSGLDVLEISRRFHMSTDQVSLILKVARKQTRSH